jgi:hypothetical protein
MIETEKQDSSDSRVSFALVAIAMVRRMVTFNHAENVGVVAKE